VRKNSINSMIYDSEYEMIVCNEREFYKKFLLRIMINQYDSTQTTLKIDQTRLRWS